MPSPFPGMDPFIEDSSYWPDFHASLMANFRAALNACLPERYVASLERNMWITRGSEVTSVLFGSPDVQVVDSERIEIGTTVGSEATATAVSPRLILLPLQRRQGTRFLRIMDRLSHRVVSAIELLSPSNKRSGDDRQAYLMKRDNYLAGGVNLIELDFLRAGERLPLGEPEPKIPDFYALVSRARDFPETSLWPLSIRDPLPVIPVPLDTTEKDVALDLPQCVQRAYDEGRYSRIMDYDRPLSPPLDEQDEAWVHELLEARTA